MSQVTKIKLSHKITNLANKTTSNISKQRAKRIVYGLIPRPKSNKIKHEQKGNATSNKTSYDIVTSQGSRHFKRNLFKIQSIMEHMFI